jgi:hypothetical protein
MASTRQSPQLLEPSNLLEPLDLTEQQLDFVYSSTRPQNDENSQKRFPATTANAPVLRASEGRRRSPLTSFLIVAGAVACFGAGTVLSQLYSLTRGDLGPGSIIGSASQPSSPIAEVATKLDEASPIEPRSTERISAEPKSAAVTSNDSPTSPALNATAAAPAASSAEGAGSGVARPAHAAPHAQPPSVKKDALADCAAPCNQQACPKGDANCLEGGPLSSAKELTTTDGTAANPAAVAQPVGRTGTTQSADSERAQTRASARQDERASRRSKRSVQRDRADNQAVAKRNAAPGTRWSRVEDRGVEWRRDRGDGRWHEGYSDRAWNWRRDRYDDYGRDGERRFGAARNGDFQIGRAERREGPLMMMLPPARYPW